MKEPKLITKKTVVRIVALALCLLMVAATVIAAMQGMA